MQACRTVGRRSHVVFTRPDNFHGSADHLGNEGCFHRVIMLQAAAESSAHQRYIYFDLIRIETYSRGHRVTAILGNLGGRPQLAEGALKMSGAVSRLHGSM